MMRPQVVRLSRTSDWYGTRLRRPPKISKPELLKAAIEWKMLIQIACGSG